MNDLGSKQVMAQNIQKHMELKGVDRNRLCNDLGLKYSTVSEWLSAKKYPRIDKIEALANYFGVLKSDLIEDKDSSNTNENDSAGFYYINEETRQIAQEIHDNADMRGLFDIARDTSPERLRAYCEFLKQLHDQDKTDE